MPDREKAINGLREMSCRATWKDIDRIRDKFQPIINDAINLLKEQEAKPVIVTTNAYGTRFYHCPKCNRDLYVYPRQLYCSNCGQKVKWND